LVKSFSRQRGKGDKGDKEDKGEKGTGGVCRRAHWLPTGWRRMGSQL